MARSEERLSQQRQPVDRLAFGECGRGVGQDVVEHAPRVADDADLSAGRSQIAMRERVEITGGKGQTLR